MSDIAFLKSKGIESRRIFNRYVWALKKVHGFVNIKRLAKHIRIDTTMVRTAVYDYFVDVARLKEFHGITHINIEKVAGYTGYWMLRRKPIQVVSPFPGSEFINELFVTALLLEIMLSDRKIDGNQCQGNATFQEFQSHLFHHLKYRPVTQQSLELMVGAFFCGCDFCDSQALI